MRALPDSLTAPLSRSLSPHTQHTHSVTPDTPNSIIRPPQLSMVEWRGVKEGGGEHNGAVLSRHHPAHPHHPAQLHPHPPLVAAAKEGSRSTWGDRPMAALLSRIHLSQLGQQLAPRGAKLVITKLLN